MPPIDAQINPDATDNIAVGSWGEDQAVEYLESIGYRIIERNKKYSIGEIDIVAKHGDIFVLVEVKAGRTGKFGYAFERVGPQKKRKLKQLAARFTQDYPDADLRIDLINVNDAGQVIHIKNAIEGV